MQLRLRCKDFDRETPESPSCPSVWSELTVCLPNGRIRRRPRPVRGRPGRPVLRRHLHLPGRRPVPLRDRLRDRPLEKMRILMLRHRIRILPDLR